MVWGSHLFQALNVTFSVILRAFYLKCLLTARHCYHSPLCFCSYHYPPERHYNWVVKRKHFIIQTIWVWIQAPPLTGCVTLGKLLSLSISQILTKIKCQFSFSKKSKLHAGKGFCLFCLLPFLQHIEYYLPPPHSINNLLKSLVMLFWLRAIFPKHNYNEVCSTFLARAIWIFPWELALFLE